MKILGWFYAVVVIAIFASVPLYQTYGLPWQVRALVIPGIMKHDGVSQNQIEIIRVIKVKNPGKLYAAGVWVVDYRDKIGNKTYPLQDSLPHQRWYEVVVAPLPDQSGEWSVGFNGRFYPLPPQSGLQGYITEQVTRQSCRISVHGCLVTVDGIVRGTYTPFSV